MTRLSLKAMAIAAGLLWGGAILCVGLINLADPSYGVNFMQLTSSVYPWFHTSRSVANVVIGTVDGLIDGAIAGLIFALLYNAVTHVQPHAEESHQQA
jgi:predicted DNA repair protein MutK